VTKFPNTLKEDTGIGVMSEEQKLILSEDESSRKKYDDWNYENISSLSNDQEVLNIQPEKVGSKANIFSRAANSVIKTVKSIWEELGTEDLYDSDDLSSNDDGYALETDEWGKAKREEMEKKEREHEEDETLKEKKKLQSEHKKKQEPLPVQSEKQEQLTDRTQIKRRLEAKVDIKKKKKKKN